MGGLSVLQIGHDVLYNRRCIKFSCSPRMFPMLLLYQVFLTLHALLMVRMCHNRHHPSYCLWRYYLYVWHIASGRVKVGLYWMGYFVSGNFHFNLNESETHAPLEGERLSKNSQAINK